MEKKSFHHGGTIFSPGWNNIFSRMEQYFLHDGTIFSPGWNNIFSRMEQYFLHGGTIYYQASFPLTIGRLNEKYGVCKEKVKTEVNKRGFFSF